MMENAWLNLPVKDVKKTNKFYKEIGFEPNGKHYINDELVSFLAGTNKLIVHFFKEEIFKKYSDGEVCDTSTSNELMITIGVKTKKEISEIVDKVEMSGGKILMKPQEFDKNTMAHYSQIRMDTNGIYSISILKCNLIHKPKNLKP